MQQLSTSIPPPDSWSFVVGRKYPEPYLQFRQSRCWKEKLLRSWQYRSSASLDSAHCVLFFGNPTTPVSLADYHAEYHKCCRKFLVELTRMLDRQPTQVRIGGFYRNIENGQFRHMFERI